MFPLDAVLPVCPATLTRTTTLTTGPTRTPTRTPAGTLTPTPLVVDTGIFQPVFSLKNFPPGLIQAVYPLSGSRAIISGTYGLVSVDLMASFLALSLEQRLRLGRWRPSVMPPVFPRYSH